MKGEMLMLPILEKYNKVLKIRGRAKSTLKMYNYTLINFLDNIDEDFTTIEVDIIRDYISKEQEKNKRTTVNTKIAIIKSFFKWLREEGIRDNNPTINLKKSKVIDNQRRYLKPEEIEIIRLKDFSLLNKLIFEVLLTSGIRVSEARNLDWNDINFPRRSLLVQKGKGGKSRVTKFSIRAKLLLIKYRELREDDDKWVFQSDFKKRMSVKSLQRRVSKIGEKTNLGINLTPHKLRHTFATMLSKNSTPIEVIQELLGHENLNTTKRYVHVSQDSVDFHFNQVFS
jgi:integrase/recombinase XerD